MTRGTGKGGPGLLLAVAAASLACSGLPLRAAADDAGEPGHRVRFRVSSHRQVPNDWIRAVVGVLAEDVDPAKAADRVNGAMAWALEQAKAERKVTARSGGYNTQPVYDDGKVRRWRASQDLVLEGADADAMTALLGTLQGRLQLKSFAFTVSEAQREQVEEELVAEALAAFQARAERVRKSLGASGYALDELSIETGGAHPPPMPQMERMRASAMVAPPAVEGGSSRVAVDVYGTIALE